MERKRGMGPRLMVGRSATPGLLAGLVGLCGAVAVCVVVSLPLEPAGAGGGPVELFDWGAFAKTQASLSKQVDGVVGRGAVLRRGREVVQQLHEIKDELEPKAGGEGGVRRVPEGPQRKTMPMDQAILMVRRQMVHEDKVPHDRIVGAGDVTGIVNEGDRRMEDKALGEALPGEYINAGNTAMFENCEDDSLTVEDAELCKRKAGAVKELTARAVARQIALAPPHDSDALAERDGVEGSPRMGGWRAMGKAAATQRGREEAAEALVGREYLQGRLGSGTFARAKMLLAGGRALEKGGEGAAGRHRGMISHMKARKSQLANTYTDYLSSGKGVKCTCDASKAGDEEMEGLDPKVGPACTCKGGQLTSITKTEQGGPLDTGSEGAWPQGLKNHVDKVDGYGMDAYRARPQQLAAAPLATSPASAPATAPVAAAKPAAAAKAAGPKVAHPRRPASNKAPAKGAQAAAGSAAAPHAAAPAAAAAHGAHLQAREFHAEGGAAGARGGMAGLKAIRDAVDGAGAGSKKLEHLENSIADTEKSLAAKKRAFRRALEGRQASLMRDFEKEMGEIQDGIQLTTGALAPLPGQNAANGRGEALWREAEHAVLQGEASGVSPAERAARKVDFGDVSQAERGRAARAASGSSSAIVREIMQKAKQSRLFQHPPRPKAAAGESSKRESEEGTLRRALDHQFDQVAGLREGRRGRVQRHIQGLRMVQATETHNKPAEAAQRGAARAAARAAEAAATPDHVGAGSVRQLSADANKYLREAVVGGKPTLQRAVKDALKADLDKGGPRAELRDAQGVLCTVERLKSGGCSGASAAAAAQHLSNLGGGGGGGGGLPEKHDYLSVPPEQVPHVPTVATLAGDIEKGIGSFFSNGGMSH